MILSENLRKAIQDYRYLLDRSYPEKSAIKLVGDKYQLSREERSVLYRGVSCSIDAEYRLSKKTDQLKTGNVFIDGFNILFTLANYLNGRPLFISDDGFLRDAGELKGRLAGKKVLSQTKELLLNFLIKNPGLSYFLFFDKPVSNSGRLASDINHHMQKNHVQGEARTCDSPDYMIISGAMDTDTVCSSDSVIITRSRASVYDLSCHLLHENYNTRFVRLSEIFES
jgi:hypothetical protein